MIEGLEHGQSYSITYKGNRKEEVITQDDLNVMIDKVYVSGNYKRGQIVGYKLSVGQKHVFLLSSDEPVSNSMWDKGCSVVFFDLQL